MITLLCIYIYIYIYIYRNRSPQDNIVAARHFLNMARAADLDQVPYEENTENEENTHK